MFFHVIVAIAGIYMLFMGIVTNATGGMLATVMFKVIPVMLGFSLLLYAAKLFGLV